MPLVSTDIMTVKRDFLRVKQTEFTLSEGSLLIAAPLSPDMLFNRSVILLTDYNKETVAGVIVNKPTPFVLDRLVDSISIKAPLYIGGPVSPEMLFLLHNHSNSDAASAIRPGIFFGYNDQLLKQIEQRLFPSIRYKFILGYSGWAPGQLEAEIANNYWVIGNPTPELLFNTEPDQIWHKAVSILGKEYEHWLKIPESPHLN